jgi:hypothetical protein
MYIAYLVPVRDASAIDPISLLTLPIAAALFAASAIGLQRRRRQSGLVGRPEHEQFILLVAARHRSILNLHADAASAPTRGRANLALRARQLPRRRRCSVDKVRVVIAAAAALGGGGRPLRLLPLHPDRERPSAPAPTTSTGAAVVGLDVCTALSPGPSGSASPAWGLAGAMLVALADAAPTLAHGLHAARLHRSSSSAGWARWPARSIGGDRRRPVRGPRRVPSWQPSAKSMFSFAAPRRGPRAAPAAAAGRRT